MDQQEFTKRRKQITQLMSNGELLIIFAGSAVRKTADEDYPFFASRNFLYLTGIKQEGTVLVAAKQDDIVAETIYCHAPDEKKEIWTGRRLRDQEIFNISGIEQVKDVLFFDQDMHKQMASGKYKTLWLCFDVMNPQHTSDIEHVYASKIKSSYPEIQIRNIYHNICSIRRYKSLAEIEAIRKGMAVTNQGIRRMMKAVKPGIMEYQLEAEFDYELKMHGQRNSAFPSIIAYGERNFYLHYPLPIEKIDDGGLVLTDVGAPYDDYCTDISRVFPSNGRFSDKQTAIYQIAYEANREIMRQIKPGQPFAITNQICREISYRGLKDIGLIKHFSDIDQYVWHGVSHHIGLDTHDVGGYDDNMAENMVFTVDAGLYIREWGIGLRIEDNVLVTSDGCENLSSDIPVTISEIEEIMGS